MADQVTAEQSLRVEALRLAVSLQVAGKIETSKQVVPTAAYFEKYMTEGTKK